MTVFLFLIIYQILLTFQGFDICDTGFYATFYQNIFSNPSSVEYNFLFWFTGIIGGVFVKLFPFSGLFGIRVLGVATVSFTIYFVYRLLNKNINVFALYLGLIIVTFSFVAMPVEFYHNSLSSLLFVSASLALFKGLVNNKLYLFALSGFLIALNTFTRLPNILDIGILLIIIIYCYYYKESKSICIKRILLFVSGFIISFFIILLLMKQLGHYDIFIKSIKELKINAIKNSTSHGISPLIKMNLLVYLRVLFRGTIAFLLFIIFSKVLSLKIFNTGNLIKWLAILVSFFVISCYIWTSNIIITLYYFSLISVLLTVLFSKEKQIKILCYLGLFMLLVMPLGSDNSIYSFGKYTVWLAIPLSINLFFTETFSKQTEFNLRTLNNKLKFRFNIFIIKLVPLLFLISFIFKLMYETINTSYADPGNRIYKTYKINNKKANYIYTTFERATIINDLLSGIKPYIKEGDYLIVYESFPMLYYLTNTIPFLHDSWLIGINGNIFRDKLNRIKKEKNPLPMVVRQKFETIGEFGSPFAEYISDNHESIMVSKEQSKLFNQFLVENKYKIIWENHYFILYTTQK
ncbi:MAG: hypothetical protein ACOYO1_10840 [Bacteroidales bacterium]